MSKKHFLVALKVLISGGLIWFLLASVDLGALKSRILTADLTALFAAAVAMLAQLGVAGLRWWAVMRAIGHPLPWLELTRLFYIGSFFSQALPSSVGGDPIRIYMAYKDGVPLKKAINGVFLERLVTVVTLVLVVGLVLPLFLPRLSETAQDLTLTSTGLLGLAIVGGFVFLCNLDRLPSGLQRFRVVRGISALAVDTRRLYQRPGPGSLAAVFGAITHVNISTAFFFVAVALEIDAAWTDFLVLIPMVVLVTTLPISIAGWGVRESAMVAAFALVGVSADAALALSLLFGVMIVFIMIPGGLLWLLGRRAVGDVSIDEAAAIVEEEISHLDDEEKPRT